MEIVSNNVIATMETLTDPQRRQGTSQKSYLIQMKRAQHAAEDREFTVTAEGRIVCGHALIQDVQDNREKSEQAHRHECIRRTDS